MDHLEQRVALRDQQTLVESLSSLSEEGQFGLVSLDLAIRV